MNGWTESLHPRAPKGKTGGGRFASAPGGGAPAKTAGRSGKVTGRPGPMARAQAHQNAAQKLRAETRLLGAQIKAAQKSAAAQVRQTAHMGPLPVGPVKGSVSGGGVAGSSVSMTIAKPKTAAKTTTTTAAKKVAAGSTAATAIPLTQFAPASSLPLMRQRLAALQAQHAMHMSRAQAYQRLASSRGGFGRGPVRFAGEQLAIELGGTVKTPAPQRAAGRKKLAKAGEALPGGSFPIPDVDYLKKAIRSVGRAPASKRPALKALIRKRAKALGATNAPGVKGTWAFQGSNDSGTVLEFVGPKGYIHGWIHVGPGGHAESAIKGDTEKTRSHLDSAAKAAHAGRDAEAVNHLTAAQMASKDKAVSKQIGEARNSLAAKVMGGKTGKHDLSTAAGRRRAVESADVRTPAGRALVRKAQRAAENAVPISHVPGRSIRAANDDSEALEMAMPPKMPMVRGAADVQLSRVSPGAVNVMHKSTGMKVGTLASKGGSWTGVHSTGKTTAPSGTMPGALSALIAMHNQIAAKGPAPAVKTMANDGLGTISGTLTLSGSPPLVIPSAPVDLAGSLPYTSSASSGDGPRITTMGGAGKAKAMPAVKLKTGLSSAGVAAYRKLRRKGMTHAQALPMAKRAASMHAKATAKAA